MLDQGAGGHHGEDWEGPAHQGEGHQTQVDIHLDKIQGNLNLNLSSDLSLNCRYLWGILSRIFKKIYYHYFLVAKANLEIATKSYQPSLDASVYLNGLAG